MKDLPAITGVEAFDHTKSADGPTETTSGKFIFGKFKPEYAACTLKVAGLRPMLGFTKLILNQYEPANRS